MAVVTTLTVPSSTSALTGMRTCNDNSIIRCGALAIEELLQKYDANAPGDLDDIYTHYGISRADMTSSTSEVKIGRVYKDGGRVTIGTDETVATNSYSAGRKNLSGSTAVVIGGTTYYQRSDTRNYTSTYYDAFILMRGGEFYRAIMMSCGNPVIATPVPKPAPGVTIVKKIDAVDHKTVNIDQAFTYTLTVRNTGNVELKQVAVTDSPKAGIQLLSANSGTITQNSWRTIITSLAKSESRTFTIRAKVPSYIASELSNTACVDTPETAASPDACDTVTVDVPAPKDVSVCNPTTGDIITVKETETDNYKSSTDTACGDMRVCIVDTKIIKMIRVKDFNRTMMTDDLSRCSTPKVLPVVTTVANTGQASILGGVASVGSLTAVGYYLHNSRQRIISSLLKK